MTYLVFKCLCFRKTSAKKKITKKIYFVLCLHLFSFRDVFSFNHLILIQGLLQLCNLNRLSVFQQFIVPFPIVIFCQFALPGSTMVAASQICLFSPPPGSIVVISYLHFSSIRYRIQYGVLIRSINRVCRAYF